MIEPRHSGDSSNASYASLRRKEISKAVLINENYGHMDEKSCLDKSLGAAIVYMNRIIVHNKEALEMIPLIDDVFRHPFKYFNHDSNQLEAIGPQGKTYEITVWDIGMGQKLVTLHDKSNPAKLLTAQSMADGIKMLRENKENIEDLI